jgi:hypothetical protein
VIERVRDCEPPPQGAEHVSKADQEPITQFCGQQPVLQGCDCEVSDSLHEPPHCAGEIVRERDWEPPPHGAEQVPQPDHAPTPQLTGQQPASHARDSLSEAASGQAPPLVAAT